MDNNILAFLASAIEFGVIFLFGCVGEIVTESPATSTSASPASCAWAQREDASA